jgi:isoquinoline 1-oxidoreductase beta subunit
MEGSVINGMSYLFYGGVTHRAGAVEQTNFHEVQLVRMNNAPRRVHVEIVASGQAPGGVGEPGLPPVAPALANAIFALTGQRFREFGFQRG